MQDNNLLAQINNIKALSLLVLGFYRAANKRLEKALIAANKITYDDLRHIRVGATYLHKAVNLKKNDLSIDSIKKYYRKCYNEFLKIKKDIVSKKRRLALASMNIGYGYLIMKEMNNSKEVSIFQNKKKQYNL